MTHEFSSNMLGLRRASFAKWPTSSRVGLFVTPAHTILIERNGRVHCECYYVVRKIRQLHL